MVAWGIVWRLGWWGVALVFVLTVIVAWLYVMALSSIEANGWRFGESCGLADCEMHRRVAILRHKLMNGGILQKTQ